MKLTATQLKQAFEFLPKNAKHGDICRVAIIPQAELNLTPDKMPNLSDMPISLIFIYNEYEQDWQLDNYILYYK